MSSFNELFKEAGQKKIRLLNSLNEVDSFLDFYINRMFRPHFNLFKHHRNIINFPKDLNNLRNKFIRKP